MRKGIKGISKNELEDAINRIIPSLEFNAKNDFPNLFRVQLTCFVEKQIYYSGGNILEEKPIKKEFKIPSKWRELP